MIGRLRRLARRYLPYELRLRVKFLRRQLDDRRHRVRFAANRGDEAAYPNLICAYERPLINYSGQERFFAAKQHNLRLVASCLSGTIIGPGETFSVWRLAPRPTVTRGYASAAAFKDRALTFEIGGSTCLMSTVLYNVGLLGGLEILERHCHSIDLYGEDRYFELGRDASIEYGYLDLRLRNPHDFPVLLVVETTDNVVRGRLLSSVPHEFAVTVVIDAPRWASSTTGASIEAGDEALVITGRRLVAFADGRESAEELPESIHYPVRVEGSLRRSNGSRMAS